MHPFDAAIPFGTDRGELMALTNEAPTAPQRGYRIGIDVGGTFTDFVVSRFDSGELINYKEPSTPADPSLAVANGLAQIFARYRIEPREVTLVVHGTTIGLNAILQRKGARVALVVSNGNRDVLEIARGRMRRPYDMFGDKERPLVSRAQVFPCSARASAQGETLCFPDQAELDALGARLRAADIQSVAISLLNAYAQPDIEQRLKNELVRRLPDTLVSTSTEVWPEMREYERTLVAALNAYIQPMLDQYYTRLRSRLEALDLAASIFITASNGGTLSLRTAAQRPVDTILSGPASGVVAAGHLAAELGIEKVVTVDMGGTSSDMAVCSSARPETTTLTHVGDFPLVTPTVNITAIGAGGGSIVRVDEHGLLKVGPESAGADPGPACYGRGGTQATVTDCYLAVGYLHEDAFAGGRIKLDKNAALRALETIAERLRFSGAERCERAAAAALSVATARMATEMLKELARRGADPQELALLPFGGAGPTQAAMLADEVRLSRIVIPAAPGLFCAFGALVADAKRDFIRSLKRPLDAAASARVAGLFDILRQEASLWLDEEGSLIQSRAFVRSLDMRYLGQAYELNVELPEGPDAPELSVPYLGQLFHARHKQVHGFADSSADIEIQSVRVQAIGSVGKPPSAAWQVDDRGSQRKQRQVWHAGVLAPVRRGATLVAADRRLACRSVPGRATRYDARSAARMGRRGRPQWRVTHGEASCLTSMALPWKFSAPRWRRAPTKWRSRCSGPVGRSTSRRRSTSAPRW